MYRLLFLVFSLLSVLMFSSVAQETAAPFRVAPLFNLDKPNTLGLDEAPGAETFTLFAPKATQNTYNHGVVLFPFKDKLYAQWQSSSKDEDGPDTQVMYSSSSDGQRWDTPKPLTSIEEHGIKTSGGWYSDGKTLIAYINVWPDAEKDPKQGHTVYRSSTDGIQWTEERPVTEAYGQPVLGIIEQDVRALPSGRLLTAFHLQPGLQCTPYYTDDPLGVSGWTAGALPPMPGSSPTMSRGIEPSWFSRSDDAVVMVFRDQESSFKKLASLSKDQGVTWSTPVLINTPDSRAKQSAGNLPDGTAFMVNNPTDSKRRFPLVITLSDDGFFFDRAFRLRSGGNDLQALRVHGKYKRAGYSYPKSVLWQEHLYVGYATNKEDVQLTRIPISHLGAISDGNR